MTKTSDRGELEGSHATKSIEGTLMSAGKPSKTGSMGSHERQRAHPKRGGEVTRGGCGLGAKNIQKETGREQWTGYQRGGAKKRWGYSKKGVAKKTAKIKGGGGEKGGGGGLGWYKTGHHNTTPKQPGGVCISVRGVGIKEKASGEQRASAGVRPLEGGGGLS